MPYLGGSTVPARVLQPMPCRLLVQPGLARISSQKRFTVDVLTSSHESPVCIEARGSRECCICFYPWLAAGSAAAPAAALSYWSFASGLYASIYRKHTGIGQVPNYTRAFLAGTPEVCWLSSKVVWTRVWGPGWVLGFEIKPSDAEHGIYQRFAYSRFQWHRS